MRLMRVGENRGGGDHHAKTREEDVPLDLLFVVADKRHEQSLERQELKCCVVRLRI